MPFIEIPRKPPIRPKNYLSHKLTYLSYRVIMKSLHYMGGIVIWKKKPLKPTIKAKAVRISK